MRELRVARSRYKSLSLKCKTLRQMAVDEKTAPLPPPVAAARNSSLLPHGVNGMNGSRSASALVSPGLRSTPASRIPFPMSNEAAQGTSPNDSNASVATASTHGAHGLRGSGHEESRSQPREAFNVYSMLDDLEESVDRNQGVDPTHTTLAGD